MAANGKDRALAQQAKVTRFESLSGYFSLWWEKNFSCATPNMDIIYPVEKSSLSYDLITHLIMTRFEPSPDIFHSVGKKKSAVVL